MDARVDKPIVSTDHAAPGKPVVIKVETAPTPVDPNSPEERAELIPQQSWQSDPLFYELTNFLGVDSREYESAAEKVSVITDWAINKAGSNKAEDIMRTVRDLEDKLQPPPWGEKRYTHIYRFLRLESQYDARKKALGSYTRTGKWD